MRYKATKRHGTVNCILLRERNKSEKMTYFMILITKAKGKGKIVERVDARSWAGRGGGMSRQNTGVTIRSVRLFRVILHDVPMGDMEVCIWQNP